MVFERLNIDKKQFRQQSLQKLKKLANSQNRLYLDKKTNQNLQKILKKLNPKSILFYLPLAHEADITETLKVFRKKVKIFVPFVRGDSFVMVSYSLPMRVGRFGIKEPTSRNRIIKKIDCAVVPIVGVDSRFARIGHGKGMYDRFFETLKNRPYTIFVQRKLCISREILGELHDIKADFVVTSEGVVYNTPRR